MAATFSLRAAGEGFHSSKVPGAYYDDLLEVTAGTADYTAGGYLVTMAQLQTANGNAGLLIESVEVADHWRTAAGGGVTAYLAVWDAVNNKVQAYGMAAAAGVSTGFTEIANGATGLNGLRCTLRVRWR